MTITLPAALGSPAFRLRCWLPDEAPVMHALITANLEHLRPWMPWIAAEPLPPAERRALLERWAHDRATGGDAIYGIFLDDRPVGNCGLHRRIGPRGLEIGYWVAAEHTRRGVATRAAALLVDAAFAGHDIDVVEIHHDVRNEASGGVPRRLGFTRTADRPGGVGAPGESGVERVWRIGRAEWAALGAEAGADAR